MPGKRRVVGAGKNRISKATREELSIMRKQDKVIAVCCSDIHLSLRPPRCRRHEEDWFLAMKRQLDQLVLVAQRYKVPIICAGDVFHHWKSEPELINFALNHLPEMYAIPGQHDLPLHNFNLIKKSSFWTMVLSGKIIPIMPNKPMMIDNKIILHGFPWGFPVESIEEQGNKKHVAVVHEYFWTGDYKYTGAPEDNEASYYKESLEGYFASVFGDNHIGFLTKMNNAFAFNCGGFMRRSVDQEEYSPQIGLLCESGNFMIHRLSTSGEAFESKEEDEKGCRKKMSAVDLEDFLNGLGELQHKTIDFIEAMEYAMTEKQTEQTVRQIILEALGRG